MADREARCTARESPVGKQRAGLPQSLRLEVAGGIEHFLHAWPALGPFIADHHYVAGHHLSGQDRGDGSVLAFIDLGRPGELEDAVIDPGGLHDAAIQRDVAVEHGQPAILTEGVFLRTDHPVLAVGIKLVPAPVLAEGGLGRNAAGGGLEEGLHRRIVGALDIPLVERIAQRAAVHGRQAGVEQAGAIEFAQDGHDPAGAVDVFHVDVALGRGDLGQARHLAAQPVDVLHGEVHPGFLGGGQQVQHGIGRSAHRNVEAHRVFEGFEAGNAARQDAGVILLVPALAQFDRESPGLEEQRLAIGMGSQLRAVAGQRKAQRLGQAVHRIGGEHAAARSAGRTGRTLDRLHFLVGVGIVGRRDHRVDQVERDFLALEHDLARFHRPARDEHARDVYPHRRHQHAGRDLVAVGNADHRIGAVGVDHVFDGVGNQVAAGQRIEHPIVAHGDPVIDRDSIEFLGNPARRLDLARDHLAEVLEVDVPRHELGEGVDHGDDRLAEIAVLHARRPPQPARAGHVAAMGGSAGTIGRHFKGLRLSGVAAPPITACRLALAKNFAPGRIEAIFRQSAGGGPKRFSPGVPRSASRTISTPSAAR